MLTSGSVKIGSARLYRVPMFNMEEVEERIV